VDAISHDELVRRSFERQTALFAGPDAIFAMRAESTVSWVEPLDADMILLDVACGAGHVAEALAPYVRQVVGIDLTQVLLDLGNDRLRGTAVGNVLLQRGNANDLPFVDDSFDLVVCRSSVHHFPDPEPPMREMARVCRPGGRVVVSDMVVPNDGVRVAFDELHTAMDPSHARALLEQELAELMARVVGPLTHGTTNTSVFPIDVMLTDVADRDAVMARLQDELAGGAPTGFSPELHDDELRVAFTGTVIHAQTDPG